jgi:hypothetical protein
LQHVALRCNLLRCIATRRGALQRADLRRDSPKPPKKPSRLTRRRPAVVGRVRTPVSRPYAHAHAGATRALAQPLHAPQRNPTGRRDRRQQGGMLRQVSHLPRPPPSRRACGSCDRSGAPPPRAGRRGCAVQHVQDDVENMWQRSATHRDATRRVATQRNGLQQSTTCCSAAQRSATERRRRRRRRRRRIGFKLEPWPYAVVAVVRLRVRRARCVRAAVRIGVCASRAEGYSDYVRRG